jgi:hypothetical protein
VYVGEGMKVIYVVVDDGGIVVKRVEVVKCKWLFDERLFNEENGKW